MADPPLNLTHAQRKIVAHFGERQFIADAYERETYFRVVTEKLRTTRRLTDQHVVAAAIEATTTAKNL
jgi:hypothetical protein